MRLSLVTAASSPARTLPLGIDIGTTRVRVALAQRRAGGEPELLAVATRARGAELGRIVADAVAELRTRERRCVIGVGEPEAGIHVATFPPMRRREFERAARFEATRLIDYPIADADVRIAPIDAARGSIAIGVVRKDRLADLKSTAQTARLRLIAVDHSAFALARALPDADAVLDVGANGSSLYMFGGPVPRMRRLRIGGAAFTQAIASALGTDIATAERRKEAHGIAGSGEDVREQLVEGVANALVECRTDGYGDVRRIALVGNGARLVDLAAIIERATAIRVTLATLEPQRSPTLPPDVLRGAAPDWCQAYGLALWDVT